MLPCGHGEKAGLPSCLLLPARWSVVPFREGLFAWGHRREPTRERNISRVRDNFVDAQAVFERDAQ
jgi:hypothetical protein